MLTYSSDLHTLKENKRVSPSQTHSFTNSTSSDSQKSQLGYLPGSKINSTLPKSGFRFFRFTKLSVELRALRWALKHHCSVTHHYCPPEQRPLQAKSLNFLREVSEAIQQQAGLPAQQGLPFESNSLPPFKSYVNYKHRFLKDKGMEDEFNIHFSSFRV